MRAPRVTAIARVALALAGVAAGAVATLAPRRAEAQTGVMVVALPFQGDASDALREHAEDVVRDALVARGAQVPERATVRAAMPVSPPNDTASIVGFGRSMGGTHVVTGRLTPLTGQFRMELRLYEVATSRVATQQRIVGVGDEDAAAREMVTALFAPGALQLSPEDAARQEEERRRQEEERRRQDEERRRADDERRRQEEERRRQDEQRRRDEERRRREEADRNRRVYRFAEGGLASFGGAFFIGARISDVPPRPGAQPPDATTGGLRLEGGYAVLPRYGLEVGGTGLVFVTPTNAIAIGPTARIALPASGFLPLRGSAGVTLGLFQGLSGGRATSLWLAFDARAEYDVAPSFTAFAGVTLDSVPGVFGSFGGVLGVRFRFGDTPQQNASQTAQPASQNAQPAAPGE